ncbi:amidohydrolase family protein [Kitasatospora sp. NPDC017646]|uniref:amidohydrolase family protein n=1 Tax=Kitasatospora sp. NPDC017646 TaxID=3364024 RepID=UPI0037AFEF95
MTRPVGRADGQLRRRHSHLEPGRGNGVHGPSGHHRAGALGRFTHRRRIAGTTGAPALARRLNDAAAQIIERHPSRFGALAHLPLLDVDAALTEITHALDVLALDGVILATNDGGHPGEPALEPILAELDRRRATVVLHPPPPRLLRTDRAGPSRTAHRVRRRRRPVQSPTSGDAFGTGPTRTGTPGCTRHPPWPGRERTAHW